MNATQHCLIAAGSLYRMHDGRQLPLSLPGGLDAEFDLPYSPTCSFPEQSLDPCAASGTSTAHQSACSREIAVQQGKLLSLQMDMQQCDSLPSDSNDGQLHASNTSPESRGPAQLCSHHDSLATADSDIANTFSRCQPAVGDGGECGIGTGAHASELSVDSPMNAHFMAMAAKLIYERPEIIADCLQHRWDALVSCDGGWHVHICSRFLVNSIHGARRD